jgi:hypothetical protein
MTPLGLLVRNVIGLMGDDQIAFLDNDWLRQIHRVRPLPSGQ